MELQKTLLVILITLIVVILFNFGIYSYAKKRGSQINLFTNVYRRAKNPFRDENEKLQELSRNVAKYKNYHSQEEEEAG